MSYAIEYYDEKKVDGVYECVAVVRDSSVTRPTNFDVITCRDKNNPDKEVIDPGEIARFTVLNYQDEAERTKKVASQVACILADREKAEADSHPVMSESETLEEDDLPDVKFVKGKAIAVWR